MAIKKLNIKIYSVLKYIWFHRSNRGRKFFAICDAIKWQIYKKLSSKPVDISIFSNFKLRCYPDSTSASSVIYCNQMPDYDEMSFMRRFLRNGDSVLDVGANIGVYTLLAASLVGPTGSIISFEPGPKAFDRLIENIKLNNLNNVIAHACAVGEQNGFREFLSDYDTTNRIKLSEDLFLEAIKVPIVRLDDIVTVKCTFGKMDIEGAEPLALIGAEKLLKRSLPPVWLLELNGSLRSFNWSEEEFKNWLARFGYDLCLFDADSTTINFKDTQPWLKSPNVLAIARNKRDWIKQRCGASLLY